MRNLIYLTNRWRGQKVFNLVKIRGMRLGDTLPWLSPGLVLEQPETENRCRTVQHWTPAPSWIALGDSRESLQCLEFWSHNWEDIVGFLFFWIRKLSGVITCPNSFLAHEVKVILYFVPNSNQQNCSGCTDKHSPLTISVLTNSWLTLTLFMNWFPYSQRRLRQLTVNIYIQTF